MKPLLILLLSCAAVPLHAQNQKLSRDSARLYLQELNNLRQSVNDSLTNSPRYKELLAKVRPENRKVITVELLANFGVYFTDFKNLNERLRSMGIEEIKKPVPSMGISVTVNKPIMSYGVELNSYVLSNKSASFKGVQTRFFTGTNLFRNWPIVLHPQIGYTGSFLNMFISKPAAQTNFNDLFLTQANNVQLRHGQDYLDMALGLKFKHRHEKNFYWQFLRIGYRYGLKEQEWKMQKGTLLNAPKDRNNQFYLQFCIGFDRD